METFHGTCSATSMGINRIYAVHGMWPSNAVFVSGYSMKYLDEEIESFLSDLARRIAKMKPRRFQQLVNKMIFLH